MTLWIRRLLPEAYVGSRCLHVVMSLGLADVVTDDPGDVSAVAREVGADPDALMRIVRHLASLGIFLCSGELTWLGQSWADTPQRAR